MPIYKVQHGEEIRLVDADNKAQAFRHCAAPLFKIEPANATEVGRMMSAGKVLEDAKAQQMGLEL
jgi:hypothetical protein